MAKGIVRNVERALKRVNEEISGFCRGKDGRQGFYAGGLASEGYSGGYRDALSDILLALNGVQPERRNYWRDYR